MEYWIIKGRQTVETVLKNCFMWNLVKGKLIVPPKTPSLPNFTVNCSFAFESVGVDFAGPWYVKGIYSRNENLEKLYIKEIKQDVSANTLFLTLARFMACHGNPRLFISDNFK